MDLKLRRGERETERGESRNYVGKISSGTIKNKIFNWLLHGQQSLWITRNFIMSTMFLLDIDSGQCCAAGWV